VTARGGAVSKRLTLAADGVDQFTGSSIAGRHGRAYGGNLLAEALLAAGACVPEGRVAHSLHAYFVRPAPADRLLRYTVTRVRDGKTSSVRQVATVGDDGLYLTMLCSFATRVASTEHQRTPAPAPPPEAVPLVDALFPGANRDLYNGLEVRAIEPDGKTAAEPGPPRQRFWVRIKERLAEDPLLRAAVLTYLSDLGITRAGDRPHLAEAGVRTGASLDHAVWFHREVRPDEWLLVEQDSPTYASSRALCHAAFYDLAGRLVASCVQEALIRRRPADQPNT
jgi:acyl-CoA thioesterase II